MKLPHRLLLFILVLSLFFRLCGLNWDQDQHLHPDERFITMVTAGIHWPTSLSGFFDTRTSTANPHNVGFPFFVYGTFPIFFVKLISQLIRQDNYTYITLVGRVISALLDTTIVLLVYDITTRITRRAFAGILAAFTYGLSILPIQLAHFYATDTHLVFFITLTFFLLLRLIRTSHKLHFCLLSFLVGLSFGLAVASKVTAVLFSPVILFILMYHHFPPKRFIRFVIAGLLIFLSFIFSVRVFQPYLFTGLMSPNQLVIANWKQLKSFDNPNGWFPPAVQWIKTSPLFPLENICIWGLGPIFSLICLTSLVRTLLQPKKYPILWFISAWVVGVFLYQSTSFAKPMRYFYPLYPFLALITGIGLADFFTKYQRKLAVACICLPVLFSSFSFVSIYLKPHSRIQASNWINSHLPENTTLTCEYWDDCLPMGGGQGYHILELPLYNKPDSSQKMQDIAKRLSSVDYLILSSNRLYGSIMTVPDMYPQTTLFYRNLFSNQSGFTKVAEFSSRPFFPFPGISVCLTPPFINYGKVAFPSQNCAPNGISLVDDYADESFTVYDHPKVLIFQKTPPSF
jgi:4-amino-4-deoxy-L-arabinose transferase-like glycosyltransferase